MHLGQGDADQHEQQHEAAAPDAQRIIERAENDWQDETAKAANHANHAADRAHMLRVVDRDVLVDLSLA